MDFDLASARSLLARTPTTLQTLLAELPEPWTHEPEGPGRWSAFDVVGHLIHGELTDWMPRAHIILAHGPARAFEPFDRLAQLRADQGTPLPALLERFASLRRQNLEALDELHLTPAELDLAGRHPELGRVTLRQLLSTWVVHDLGHVAQVARVMAKRYASEVGQWTAYLGILKA